MSCVRSSRHPRLLRVLSHSLRPVLQFTHHASRFTFHVSRFTFSALNNPCARTPANFLLSPLRSCAGRRGPSLRRGTRVIRSFRPKGWGTSGLYNRLSSPVCKTMFLSYSRLIAMQIACQEVSRRKYVKVVANVDRQ